MCGREVVRGLKRMARQDPKGRTVAELVRTFIQPALIEDRFNLAPMQQAITLDLVDGGWEPKVRRWGLVPSWSKDESFAAKCINAKAETLAEKPSFRAAFKKSRTLQPVSGFYEWAEIAGKKRPYFIHPLGPEEHWLFAGLAETWRGPDGMLETFTVITTEANAAMSELHHRMPVILGPGDAEAWLDPATQPADLLALLRPCPAKWIEAYEVGAAVGNVRNDSPNLVEPVA